jgi:hypothetical protein
LGFDVVELFVKPLKEAMGLEKRHVPIEFPGQPGADFQSEEQQHNIAKYGDQTFAYGLARHTEFLYGLCRHVSREPSEEHGHPLGCFL